MDFLTRGTFAGVTGPWPRQGAGRLRSQPKPYVDRLYTHGSGTRTGGASGAAGHCRRAAIRLRRHRGHRPGERDRVSGPDEARARRLRPVFLGGCPARHKGGPPGASLLPADAGWPPRARPDPRRTRRAHAARPGALMKMSSARRPAMAVARTLIAVGSRLVPADARAEWIRDWQAEVAAVADRGRSPVRFAWGAPRHALALRRDDWGLAVVSSDVRFAWRFLRRQPALVTAAGVTIAVGIGATLAMFGVVDSILFTPLPYRDPARLVELWERNPLFNWTDAEIAPANLFDWRARNVVFADVASYMGGADRLGSSVRLTLGGQDPRPFDVLQVSANFFELLGVAPAIGRTFAPGEDIPDRHRVIVLAERFWRTAFGGRSDVVNERVSINGREWTVIGVMPASFTFAEQRVDAWIPLAMDAAQTRTMRQAHLLRAIARLKPGVTVPQAQHNLAAIARDLEREYPKTNRQMAVGVGPLSEWWVGPSRQSLLLFLAAVVLVLLIACANVANLLIVRTAERTHDLALRAALGASRSRLLRQLLMEALMLASVGTAAGLLLALVLLRLFVAFAPPSLPRVDEVGLNGVVVLVAVALTGLIAVLVGLAPAAIASRVDLRDAIASTGRSVLARD